MRIISLKLLKSNIPKVSSYISKLKFLTFTNKSNDSLVLHLKLPIQVCDLA